MAVSVKNNEILTNLGFMNLSDLKTYARNNKSVKVYHINEQYHLNETDKFNIRVTTDATYRLNDVNLKQTIEASYNDTMMVLTDTDGKEFHTNPTQTTITTYHGAQSLYFPTDIKAFDLECTEIANTYLRDVAKSREIPLSFLSMGEKEANEFLMFWEQEHNGLNCRDDEMAKKLQHVAVRGGYPSRLNREYGSLSVVLHKEGLRGKIRTVEKLSDSEEVFEPIFVDAEGNETAYLAIYRNTTTGEVYFA